MVFDTWAWIPATTQNMNVYPPTKTILLFGPIVNVILNLDSCLKWMIIEGGYQFWFLPQMNDDKWLLFGGSSLVMSSLVMNSWGEVIVVSWLEFYIMIVEIWDRIPKKPHYIWIVYRITQISPFWIDTRFHVCMSYVLLYSFLSCRYHEVIFEFIYSFQTKAWILSTPPNLWQVF